MDISIIIVSWNVQEEVSNLLRSILNNPPDRGYEIIVVDNGSEDDTVQIVRSDFGQVQLICNSQNKGFAAANNQGIRLSRGQYLLLLNPDTIVEPDSINGMVEFMDKNADVGICGPMLLNADRTIQSSVRGFPTFTAYLYRFTFLRSLRIFRGSYKRFRQKGFDYSKIQDVEQLMGAALMIRRAALDETGIFDEQFFMYYEEVDLCRRMKDMRWRVIYDPRAKITHLGGKSSSQIPARKQMMMFKSLFRFFDKYCGRRKTFLFKCIFKPAYLIKLCIDSFVGMAMYLVSVICGNGDRQNKSLLKIKNTRDFLGRYGWGFMFKI